MDFTSIFTQMHERWLVTPIPALNNQDPTTAFQTEEGKKLLEKLFDFYESRPVPTSGLMSGNPSREWVYERLTNGPPKEEEYVGPKKTCRTRGSQQRLQERHKSIYLPRRCEVAGCKVTEKISSCSRCHCASYCCREHQQEDWQRHKIECKHLKNLNLSRILYSTESVLKTFPLGCFPVAYEDLSEERKNHCFVCGAGHKEVRLGQTDCCGLTICDNEFEYQMMSYSRDHCMRSHNRYTTCGYHTNNGHQGDWRTCVQCKEHFGGADGAQTRSWYSNNGYNATPALESDYPQGSFITAECGSCHGRIATGWESYSNSFSGGGIVILCSSCGSLPP